MTQTPSNQEGFGPPGEEDIDQAKVQEQIDTDPEAVPNAANRDPADPAAVAEPAEPPARDPERRAKPAPADPQDRPGPLDPGAEAPESPTNVQSFERPGEESNWEESGR